MRRKGWKQKVLPVFLATAMVLGSMNATSFVAVAATDDSGSERATASEGALIIEDVVGAVYGTGDEGNWSGAGGVQFNFNGTELVVTATNFGWQSWGIQLQEVVVTSESENNIFSFDVVSTIDKNIVWQRETGTVLQETISLKANEPYHFETAFEGKELKSTFDLTGGSAGGTLTISNMRFGPDSSYQAAPTLGATKALDKSNGFKVGEDVVLTFSQDASDWADAVTSLKVSNKELTKGTDYTIDAQAGTITIKAAAFAKQNVYTIDVEADGYSKTSFTLPVYKADVANEDWQLDWSDEFNGSALDTAKWSYEIGVKSGDDTDPGNGAPVYWGNNEKEYYIEEAVEVKDGYLVITGNALTDAVKQKYGVTDTFVKYTSGRIRTITDDNEILKATTYGRIEAKMILPGYAGYWPAFWMLPATDHYGVWAASGELDIMEAVGQNPTQVNGTIHYGGQWPSNVSSGGTYKFPEGSDINGEHVYAVEWEPGEIRWYVDDVLYQVETNWYGVDTDGEKFAYPAPFDEDFYILFNLAMSGDYVSNVDPTEMGKQMKVDYVRVYKDANTDYDTSVDAPDVDHDTASFEQYGGYKELIVDNDFATLPSNAKGDGAYEQPGTGLWWSAVNTGAGANATVSVADGAAKIDVTKQGGNDYNVQLIQNVPLAKGYTYRVTFDAWTDVTAGRAIRVAPSGDCDHGWKAYDAGINASLTTTSQTFTFDFVMNSDSDPAARLEMNIGGALGAVYIDNVSVKALTDDELGDSDENGPKTPLTNGEHIYNGTFDKGTGRLGYWTVEGTMGSTTAHDYTVKVGSEGAKLIQTGLQLLDLDEYRITFDASTLGSGKVRVTLTDESGATVYATKDYSLTTSAKSYELGFTVPEGKDTDMGKLVIEFIGTNETVTVDNVSMMRLTNVHMDWDQYVLYPIEEGDVSGWTINDEVYTWTYDQPTQATDVGNGEMGFAVKTNTGSFNYSLMLLHNNNALSKGMTYRIKYAIKATAANQPVEVKIEDNNYSPCYDENLTIGTDWTYVDSTFTSSLAAAGDLKFCLSGVDQECTVYVKDVTIEVDGIPVPQFAEGSSISTMKTGDTSKLNIVYNKKVQDKYNSFTYATSNANVVAVSADGTLTAKAGGKATITVTSMLGTKFSFDVTVSATADGDDDTHTHTGGKATCTTPATCSICGETYGSVDKNNHTGGTEIRGKIEATATKDGYTGDTYCKGCGAKIATGKAIPATGSGDSGNTGSDDGEKAPVQDGWYEKDGIKYWYENGVKQGTEGRGKEIYDGGSDAWYWLDAPNGAMAVSKDVYQESLAGDWGEKLGDDGERYGKWVRYDENGRMVKGWQDTENGTYFFDYTYGTMAKGFATIDGKEYYFNTATGVLEYEIGEVPEFGWKNIDGKDYWYENYIRQGYSMDESYRGKEIYDGASDAWYWLDNVQGGAKAVSKDVYQESLAGEWGEYTGADGERYGKWVRYDENGHMVKGWQTTEAGTYFFDYIYGTMAKGSANIEGAEYYFDPDTGIRQ